MLLGGSALRAVGADLDWPCYVRARGMSIQNSPDRHRRARHEKIASLPPPISDAGWGNCTAIGCPHPGPTAGLL